LLSCCTNQIHGTVISLVIRANIHHRAGHTIAQLLPASHHPSICPGPQCKAPAGQEIVVLTVDLATNDSCSACEAPSFRFVSMRRCVHQGRCNCKLACGGHTDTAFLDGRACMINSNPCVCVCFLFTETQSHAPVSTHVQLLTFTNKQASRQAGMLVARATAAATFGHACMLHGHGPAQLCSSFPQLPAAGRLLWLR
jgi:hypothetical protein